MNVIKTHSLWLTMKKTKTLTRRLTLVRAGTLLYPFAEEDHVLLTDLRIPIVTITEEYFPLLGIYCKRKKINIETIPFEDLENTMLERIKAKWEHELIVTHYSLLFTYPKKTKVNMDGLLHALQRWYIKHHTKTEVVTKRTAKAYKVLVKKVRD